MAEEISVLNAEERRKRRIEEAKRRAAAKLGKEVREQASPPLLTKSAAGKAQPAHETGTSPARQPVAAGEGHSAVHEQAAEKQSQPRLRAQPPTVKPLPAEVEAEGAGQPGVNRREFLTYAWGAALGLLTVEGAAATYFFMIPRFRAGEFGGKFHLGAASSLPPQGTLPPDPNIAGKYWLSHTEEGVKALYMVCTHLGCLYKWSESNQRFECPCHGSKFTAEGDYIEGPAPRSLDQFVVEVVENGTVVSATEDTGKTIVPPASPSPAAQIVVDTGRRILGKPASESPARRSV